MAPLWPNDPKTSILVRRRGSDSDGPACVDGARVSVQETKPVTFRDLDISRGQQELWITLLKPRDMSIYLAAQNLAKLQDTASRKLYPTFAAIAQLFRLSMFTPCNEKSDGALVLQTRCFSGVTVCQPDL